MEMASWCSLFRIRMFFSPLDHQVLPLLRSTVIMDPVEGTSSEEPSKSQAVSFTVFDEPPRNLKKMPKHLRSKRKAELSEATIAEKQKLAEKRRKKHMEDKLEKIHQMEEEAQRLAQAMVPLIEATQNGLPPRKLHRDDDVVNNVAERIDRDSNSKVENGDGSGAGEGDTHMENGHLKNSTQ